MPKPRKSAIRVPHPDGSGRMILKADAAKIQPSKALAVTEQAEEDDGGEGEEDAREIGKGSMVLANLSGDLQRFVSAGEEGDRAVVQLLRIGGSKGFLYKEANLEIDVSILAREPDAGDEMGAKFRCLLHSVREGRTLVSQEGKPSGVVIEPGESFVLGETAALESVEQTFGLPCDVRIRWHGKIPIKGNKTFWDLSIGLLGPPPATPI